MLPVSKSQFIAEDVAAAVQFELEGEENTLRMVFKLEGERFDGRMRL